MTSGKFGRLIEYSYEAGENSVKDWTDDGGENFHTGEFRK